MKFTSIFFTASGSIFAVYRKEIKKLRIKIRSFIYFSWFYWLFFSLHYNLVYKCQILINRRPDFVVLVIFVPFFLNNISWSVVEILFQLLKYCIHFFKDLIFNNKPLTHLNRETKVAFFFDLAMTFLVFL